jgi:hypothetical protein
MDYFGNGARVHYYTWMLGAKQSSTVPHRCNYYSRTHELSTARLFIRWGGPTSWPNIYAPAGVFSIRSCCFLCVQVLGFSSASVDSGAVLQLHGEAPKVRSFFFVQICIIASSCSEVCDSCIDWFIHCYSDCLGTWFLGTKCFLRRCQACMFFDGNRLLWDAFGSFWLPPLIYLCFSWNGRRA